MPYHDRRKPHVRFWFSGTDGGNLATFLRNFTYARIDELVRSGGLCVMYTHFARGFAPNGCLHREFMRRMEYIADKPGWFVPVSSVLDHLRSGEWDAERAIDPDELARLERRWLANSIKEETHKKGRRLLNVA